MELDEVKRFVDNLAHHKINKLHLHLSDDEAWRIEIKSHPELAEVGGFRGVTDAGTSVTADTTRRSRCASWSSTPPCAT